MSTYDFEPDPDDYGPEPPHIANPSRIGRAMQVTTDNSATLIAALAEIERLKAEYDLLALNIEQDIERKDAALRVALEALELAHPRFGVATEKYKQAIATIKEAL